MTSFSDHVFNVLVKLRAEFLAGQLVPDLRYHFSFSKNRHEENQALDYLENKGVIKSITIQESVDFDSSGNMSFTSVPVFEQKRYIDSFNSSKYEEVCKEFNLNPFAITYSATIELIDDTVPVVTAGQHTYTLPSLHSGRATDLISLAFKNPDNTVTKVDFKNETGMEPPQNFKDTIRASIFGGSGLLTAFVNSSPTSITILKQVELDEKDFYKLIAAAA